MVCLMCSLSVVKHVTRSRVIITRAAFTKSWGNLCLIGDMLKDNR